MIVMWLALVIFILAFIFSAGKNNEEYDTYALQQKYFDKYANSDSLIFARYIGDDRCEIKHGEHGLIAISTTDYKIVVELDNVFIIYDDFKHFSCNWEFKS